MNGQTHSSRGSLLFAFWFLILAVFLLSQLGEQAKFSSEGKLFAQPAFWPGVGVIGMTFFGCLNLLATLMTIRGDYSQRDQSHQAGSQQSHKEQNQLPENQLPENQPPENQPQESQNGWSGSVSPIIESELSEGVSWLLALEYLGWFMLYVYVTPIIGYLAATVIFLVALTFRIGYRERRMIVAAVVVGFAIVLIFKSFLGVKIPGGAVYELLPDSIRSFMIINF